MASSFLIKGSFRIMAINNLLAAAFFNFVLKK